jgi:mannose-6-phosphate isomerase-like protein (cupin superfamily)
MDPLMRMRAGFSLIVLTLILQTAVSRRSFGRDGGAPTPQAQGSLQHALTLPLACEGGDCALLKGAPQTAGMRSGFVRLKPGETVGWHTTGEHEEALVILRGRGEARIEGEAALPVASAMEVYIPPATRHNVANTGSEMLEYVYVVAPTGTR